MDEAAPLLSVQVDAVSLADAIVRSPTGIPTPSTLIGRLEQLTSAMESRKDYGLGKGGPLPQFDESEDDGAEITPIKFPVARQRPSPLFELESPGVETPAKEIPALPTSPERRRRRRRLRNRRHGRDPLPFRKPAPARRGEVWENAEIFGQANRHRKLSISPHRIPRPGFDAQISDARPMQSRSLLCTDHDDSVSRPDTPRSVSSVLPRIHGDGAGVTDSMRQGTSDSEDEGHAKSMEMETHHRFGGQAEIGERDLKCYVRNISEDFETYCKVGALRRRHVRFPPQNSAWRAVVDRTHEGQWAGNLNASGVWPGGISSASLNEKQLHEATRRRHEAIHTNRMQTTVPGLSKIQSSARMLGHAANLPGARIPAKNSSTTA